MTETSGQLPVTPPERRAPRWLWALLVGSLAINLAVVGSLAGFAWRHGGWGGGGHGFFFGGRLLRELPEQRQAEVKAILDRNRPATEQARQRSGEARKDAMRLFEAEPYDRAAFEAAIARMNAAELAMRSSLTAMMGEIGAKLTHEERQRALKSLRRGWFGRRGHGHGGDGPEGSPPPG